MVRIYLTFYYVQDYEFPHYISSSYDFASQLILKSLTDFQQTILLVAS